ncbi:barnase inhibitor [Streptomyces venezuelae]|nr:barnase inhibitor [Streptomyces venezuelae]
MLIELDGKHIKSAADLHRTLAEVMDFGPFYSPNLAALWDRLSADIERPVVLVWKDSESSRRSMGESEFEKLHSLLLRVEAQDASFGWTERFVVRFE